MANDINFGYVTPDKCPFEIMTPEQIAAQNAPREMPCPPVKPPPVGKNYVYKDDQWVLVDNPVHGL